MLQKITGRKPVFMLAQNNVQDKSIVLCYRNMELNWQESMLKEIYSITCHGHSKEDEREDFQD